MPIRLDLRGALLLIEIARKTTAILPWPSLFSQPEGRAPYHHRLRDTLAPADVAARAPGEQLDRASAELRKYTNQALLDTMADFPDSQRQEYGNEAPQVSAIEKAKPEEEAEEIIVQTRTWALFASGAGMDIEERTRAALILS